MDIFCIPASVIVTSMSITRDNRFNVQLINLTQDNWALILPLSPSMLRFEVTQKGEMSKKGCDVTWDRTKNIRILHSWRPYSNQLCKKHKVLFTGFERCFSLCLMTYWTSMQELLYLPFFPFAPAEKQRRGQWRQFKTQLIIGDRKVILKFMKISKSVITHFWKLRLLLLYTKSEYKPREKMNLWPTPNSLIIDFRVVSQHTSQFEIMEWNLSFVTPLFIGLLHSRDTKKNIQACIRFPLLKGHIYSGERDTFFGSRNLVLTAIQQTLKHSKRD